MAEPYHAYNEREARKEYVRKRQTFVFTVTIAALVAAFILSILVYNHVFGLGAVRSEAVEPNYGVQAPCAPVDKDGNHAKYVDNAVVHVRVLNGTKFRGFARAISEALTLRNFTVANVGNYTSTNIKRTTIFFGKSAIPEAYTLYSNFTDAKLVLTDRADKLIDVVPGATFHNLRPKEQVPGPGSEIRSIPSCVNAESTAHMEKALPHEGIQ